MKLRSDDDIYRARLVYLGPQNHTLPVQLPYAQWGIGAATFAVLALISWAITGGSWSGVGIAAGATLPLTALIFRHVDPDRPARKLIATAATDWRTTTQPTAGPEPRLTARKVQVTR